MKLIKNADLYTPRHLGIADILIANDKIVELREHIDYRIEDLQTFDLQGRIVIPGLMDQHVHSIGGGGEDGYASRVPALRFSDCVKAGITTLVGVLGTDCRTRSLTDLLAMTKGLNQQGITSYCLTGAYEYPSPTLTGSVGDDIVLISEILGVKIAISDHRCSNPTTQELIKLASEVRIAALLAKKPGVVHLHVGSSAQGISQIFEILDTTSIPIQHFRPTHMGGHLDQSLAFAKLGGYVDITTGGSAPSHIDTLLNQGCPIDRLTLSSDSNGSFPKWNEHKQIIGMTYGKMTSLFDTVRCLVSDFGYSLEAMLPLITSNIAQALSLGQHKGSLSPGLDADLVVLTDTLGIDSTMAQGTWLSYAGETLVKGMYED